MKFKVFLFGMVLYFLWLPYLVRSEEKNGTKEIEKDRKDIVVFRVKIAADQYYQTKVQSWQKDDSNKSAFMKDNDWKNDTVDLIGCVNRKFKEQGIKVKFEIAEILNWHAEEEITNLRESLEDLIKKISLKNCDLVIGLTAKAFPAGENGGYYNIQNYILIRDYSPFISRGNMMIRENKNSWTSAILLHEIGHYFLGSSHSDNPESIMNEGWSSGFKEDFLKEEIELINKKCLGN